MKILAIRGRNLASLAAPFEVDFRREPLASAGVFAICGPTGAGKSTLLDALCLALYDSTPRLAAASARGGLKDAGERVLTPRDSAHVLRRGAAEGSAEVDFVGNDGRAYRAAWALRRARGRSEGRLQNVEMALAPLHDDGTPGAPIGRLKTEVLEAIEARVGLDFEQFRRSVLLAQNEFSAFLKADDDERARLLQTLTGTDTFEAISRLTFERARDARSALEVETAARAAVAPLADDARATLEAERVQSEQALIGAQARQQVLEGVVRWHEDAATRAKRLAAAEAELRDAEAEQQAADPDRHALAALDAAQGGAALLSARDGACARHTQAERDWEAAEAARGDAATTAAAAAAAQSAGEAALAAARTARDAAGPLLERARSLDGAIALAAQQCQTARMRRTDAQEAYAAAHAAHDDLAGRVHAAAQRQADAEAWLRAHAEHAVLGSEWPRWAALLDEAMQAQAALGAAEASEAAGIAAARERAAHADLEEASVLAAAGVLTAAHAALEVVRARRAAFDARDIAAERQAAQARLDAVRDAQGAWARLAEQRARHADLYALRARAEATLQETGGKLPTLAAETQRADGRMEQARANEQMLVRATSHDVEALRGTLVDGTPCPVCGAVEHPHAGGDRRLSDALHAAQAEARACERALAECVQRERDARAAVDGAGQTLRETADAFAALTRDVAESERAWVASARAAGLSAGVEPASPAVDADAQAGRIEAAYTSAASARDEILQAERAWQAARADEATAADAFEGARAAHDAARRAADDARRAADAHAASAAAATQARATAAGTLARQLAQLAPAFGAVDWQSDWAADERAFVARARAAADAWQAMQRTASEAARAQVDLAPRLEAAVGALVPLQQSAAVAVEDDDAAATVLAARSAERSEVFGGEAAAAVQARLDSVVRDAEAGLDSAQRTHEGALAAAARADALVSAAVRQCEDASAERERVRATLEAWLAAHAAELGPDEGDGAAAMGADAAAPPGLPGEALLRARLRVPREEREALRARLQALAARVGRLQGARTAAFVEVNAHAKTRPQVATTMDAARAALDAAKADAAACMDRRAALSVRARDDDDRKQAWAERGEAIVALQREADVWARLSDLIGSNDGKKFRNFAQQMTLDVLLAYANRHLESLARRYRLERAADSLSLLVVDVDMADEIRLVHSLSGGESFLVSLALALGLASLSSHRVRVESLFIDEGFGSLDADTLRVAMDALDALQAQGRKVGVISHVPEMTERIATRIEVRRIAGGRSVVEVV